MTGTKISTAVVTGGGSGLGRAICLRLAERRAKILVADIHAERAAETVDLVRQRGGEAAAVTIDVCDAAQVEQMAEEADRFLGRTDLLVNNAGVAVAGPIGEVPLADWEWILGVNLRSVIYGCHFFVPRMKKQGGGRILNTASLAGIACAPQMSPYNVTKAGVIALSETLYSELAAHGISVTVLCPSFFRTNLADTMRSTSPDHRTALAKLFENSKLSADDVARIALDATERGKLYCLPMREGHVVWAIKRLVPQRYAAFFGSARAQKMLSQ